MDSKTQETNGLPQGRILKNLLADMMPGDRAAFLQHVERKARAEAALMTLRRGTVRGARSRPTQASRPEVGHRDVSRVRGVICSSTLRLGTPRRRTRQVGGGGGPERLTEGMNERLT